MKSSRKRYAALVGLVFLIALMVPQSAFANRFRIYFVSRLVWPLSNELVRVLGESAARYDGSVDIGDKTWSINAQVRDDQISIFQNGFGASGGNIFPGKTIHCDPNFCGADVAVSRCNFNDTNNSFTVKGVCATFQPNSPELHSAIRSPESLLCLPREPPEIPDTGCPVVIDLDKNGFHLTGMDEPVLFDIDSDGTLELVSWTDGSQLDGFLVHDVNGNGWIDGGSELFGNHSWMLDGSLAEEGYQALGEYDTFVAGGNQDRVIDRNDMVFDALRVWIDENHNGRSEPGELLTLEEVGLSSIELDYVENRRRDRHGNQLRYNSRAWMADGHSHVKTTDVFFVVQEAE